MKNRKKPTKKQKLEAYLDFMGSEMIHNIAIPSELRMNLSYAKEHLIVYMWEHFIKGEYYRMELDGMTGEDLLEHISPMELLEGFAHYQMGYWQGVNEAMNEDEEENNLF